MTPPQPHVVGAKPKMVWINGASQPDPASDGCAGGMNGE
jgi:hypothetical protein